MNFNGTGNRLDTVLNELLPRLRDLLDRKAGARDPLHSPEESAAFAERMVEPVPHEGTPLPELLDYYFGEVVPRARNAGGPTCFAYVPSGGLLESAVADLISSISNPAVGIATLAPAHAQIEANVLRWFAELLGLPESTRGFLSSGGSIANFSAIVTAREAAGTEDFSNSVIYFSDQTHYSVAKGARMAGFPARCLRTIPTLADCRIDTSALEAAIQADREQGLRPLMIIGNAGTTNSGAVDPLQELALIASQYGLWFHVDAAYGGFFNLATAGRARLRGIQAADSVTLDPHKGLFVPFGTGALLVREGRLLREAFSSAADCLPDESSRIWDFRNLSPELSRNFRGLRVWLPIKLHGVGAFRARLEELLALTRVVYEELRAMPGLEIVAPPALTTIAWRFTRPGLDADALDRYNQERLEEINREGKVFLSGTWIRDQYFIRTCMMSHLTGTEEARTLIDAIRSAAERTAETPEDRAAA